MSIEGSALQWLADISDGDARIALGNLQLVLQYNENSKKVITIEDIKEKIKVLIYMDLYTCIRSDFTKLKL